MVSASEDVDMDCARRVDSTYRVVPYAVPVVVDVDVDVVVVVGPSSVRSCPPASFFFLPRPSSSSFGISVDSDGRFKFLALQFSYHVCDRYYLRVVLDVDKAGGYVDTHFLYTARLVVVVGG